MPLRVVAPERLDKKKAWLLVLLVFAALQYALLRRYSTGRAQCARNIRAWQRRAAEWGIVGMQACEENRCLGLCQTTQ